LNPYLKLAVGGLIVFTVSALIIDVSKNDKVKRFIYDKAEYCHQYPNHSDCKSL